MPDKQADYLPPDRTMCDVLAEMRTCVKTNNFSYLKGLIEEAQSYANRMESALQSIDTSWELRKIKGLKDKKKKLKAQILKLEKKKEILKNDR